MSAEIGRLLKSDIIKGESMRKIFRFKYEPCNGKCYAWCKVLPKQLRQLTDDSRQSLVNKMVEAHSRLCDNVDYSFGLDLDEERNLFVAHFHSPEETTLFSSDSFGNCVLDVCEKVMLTNIPKGEGQCTYGENGTENLGLEILNACRDEVYQTLDNKSCACQA
jgi:hypothetical protein